MNELSFWGGLGLVALMICAKIPGLEHFVKPVIDLFFTFFKFVAENSVSWVIWLFKSLWNSHLEVISHLIFSQDKLDPTASIRKDAS